MSKHFWDKPVLRHLFWFTVLPHKAGLYLSVWEFGRCGNQEHTRRHRIKGNVQFILWRAGEQGHRQDYWHDMDSSWWSLFVPTTKAEGGAK